jgi:hypothetical protein
MVDPQKSKGQAVKVVVVKSAPQGLSVKTEVSRARVEVQQPLPER